MCTLWAVGVSMSSHANLCYVYAAILYGGGGGVLVRTVKAVCNSYSSTFRNRFLFTLMLTGRVKCCFEPQVSPFSSLELSFRRSILLNCSTPLYLWYLLIMRVKISG